MNSNNANVLTCFRLRSELRRRNYRGAGRIYPQLLSWESLVHGQVTIIFVVSGCLFVCLFVCAEFFSAVFDPIWTHVTCPGLVVSPRI